MTFIPRDPSLDSTLAFLTEGYRFIPDRFERFESDVFETRIMFRRAICAMGEDASAMFFAPDRFTRRRAMPPNALLLLQDLGSVQMLDGEAHRRRKQMFMSLMTPDRLRQLTAVLEEQWLARISAWSEMEEVVLHNEAEQLLCSAVCQWVGVPLTEAAVQQRAREFSAMIDGAGSIGPRNWRGLLLRTRTEDWTYSIIRAIRAGHMSVPGGSPAQVIAMHDDADGKPLDSDVAAVELINLMRPTVAVARYVTFAALALHENPACRERIRAADDDFLSWFVQEVRRFYPFFPAIGGRALTEFEWRGSRFPPDTWVLLDVYGTNHDKRIWGDPEVFRPERFREWNGSPYNFIPQGGGDFDFGHRCAGEHATIALMKSAARLLTLAMEYDVPQQNLRIDMARMPAIPESRFLMRKVRRAPEMTFPASAAGQGASRAPT